MKRAHRLSWALAGAGLALAATGAGAQGVVPCAAEGQVCRVPGVATVYFGVPGRTVSIVGSGPVACNNQTFGRDPAPGQRKACSYVLDGGSGGRSGRGFEQQGRGRDFDDGRRARDFDDGRRGRDFEDRRGRRDFDDEPRRRRDFDDRRRSRDFDEDFDEPRPRPRF